MGTHISGPRRLRKRSVGSSVVFSRGDMLFLVDTIGNVNDAAAFTWNTDLATTQADFANVFCGIAWESTADGETEDVSVDESPDAVYEFNCQSATYYPQHSLGPAKEFNDDALSPDMLAKADLGRSIARPVSIVRSAATKILVTFAPVFNPSANSAAGVIG